MIPDTLRIGPIPIHLFGIFVALGFLAAGWIVRKEFARRGIDTEHAWNALVWGAVGGLLGARLWAVTAGWDQFLRSPLEFLLRSGALVWYGGLLGGAIAVTLYFRSARIPWLTGADAAAPAIALGHAVGRLGCQVSGDGDWGTETTLPWGMTYPHAVVGWDYPPGVRVHPAPLYESAAYLAIFALLWRMRTKTQPPGAVFATYLVLGGLARFLVEFVRLNPRVFLGLTEAQFVSLALVAAGAVFLLVRRAPPGSTEHDSAHRAPLAAS